MKVAAIAIVVLGLGLASALALRGGLDITGAILLTLIFGMGALTVAVTRRSARGVIEPAACPSCGGLVSPNAPYCKHCGADLAV